MVGKPNCGKISIFIWRMAIVEKNTIANTATMMVTGFLNAAFSKFILFLSSPGSEINLNHLSQQLYTIMLSIRPYKQSCFPFQLLLIHIVFAPDQLSWQVPTGNVTALPCKNRLLIHKTKAFLLR